MYDKLEVKQTKDCRFIYLIDLNPEQTARLYIINTVNLFNNVFVFHKLVNFL